MLSAATPIAFPPSTSCMVRLERVVSEQLGGDLPRDLRGARVELAPCLVGATGLHLVEAEPHGAHLDCQVAQVRRQIEAPGRLARVVGQLRPNRQGRDDQGQNLSNIP